MYCNQIFSLIAGARIKNLIVADNYEMANQIARSTYGDQAIAVDTTLVPVLIGDDHEGGKFYREGIEVQPNPTEAEKIQEIEESKIVTEIDTDYRLSILELGL